MNAVIYVRYSTKAQEDGASRERQIELCRAVIAREGWTEIAVVEDLGRSAWKGDHLKNGNLGKLADQWATDGVPANTVLVTEQLDRLSRQKPRTALRWIEDRCEAGLTIATSDGHIYTDRSLQRDLSQILTILIKAATAAEESDKKSTRVTDAKVRAIAKAQAREGAWVINKRCPGWLAVKPGRDGFDVIEERAQVVRDIYKMSANGYGTPKIAKTLNERGIPAWRTDTGWDTSYIKYILTQPAVEGDYEVGAGSTKKLEDRPKLEGKIIGYYEHRIVDANLVRCARAAMNDRRVTRGRTGDGIANLFAGLVKCSECGGPCYVGWSKASKSRYMRCDNAIRARGCTNTKLYNYSKFERAAVDKVLMLAVDDRFFAKVDQLAPLANAVAESEKAIADLTAQTRRLGEFIARMTEDNPIIMEQADQKTRELRDLTTKHAELVEAYDRARGRVSPAEQAKAVLDIKDAMASEDLETRREARHKVQTALKGIVDWVSLSPDQGLGERRIIVRMIGGAHAIMFDNAGKTLVEWKPGTDFEADDPRGEAYMKRLKGAA